MVHRSIQIFSAVRASALEAFLVLSWLVPRPPLSILPASFGGVPVAAMFIRGSLAEVESKDQALSRRFSLTQADSKLAGVLPRAKA